MSSIIVALPILAGKEEPWRRFAQELTDSRRREYEEFRERMGLGGESVWIAGSRGREMAVFYVESEDPDRLLRRLVESGHPFDVWFKKKISEFHGCDFTGDAPEFVFAFPPLRGLTGNSSGSPTEWALPRRERR